MKNLARVLIIGALVLAIIAGMVNCAKNDYFNFDHPEDAWATDCLMFFDKPLLDQKDEQNLAAMFGYAGESGIASEFAAKHDSAINVMYDYAYGVPTNDTAYIVYLIYGTDCRGATPDTYFRIAYMEGDSVVYDGADGGIEIGAPETYGGVEASLDMTKAPSDRLSVRLTDETAYGAIVIPIRFRYQNPIGTTLFVDMSVELERKNKSVDTGEKFIFEKSVEIDPLAEITKLSVGYLSENDYNNGYFDDSAITADTALESGTPCYMVLDFKIKTLKDNVNHESVRLMTYLSDKDAILLKIQEAPTGKIEMTDDGTRSKIHAVYTLPEKKGSEKTVRMILKLLPGADCDVSFDIFVSSSTETILSGEIHKFLDFHIGA